MTPLYYVYSNTSPNVVFSVEEETIYISIMSWNEQLRAETIYGQTFWPSATNTMSGITPIIGTFANN